MKQSQIAKITQAPISESLYNIITRLEAGHHVNSELIMATPEVRLAEQCVSNQGIETCKLDQGPRRVLQNSLLRNINSLGSYSGTVVDEKGEKKACYDGVVGRDKQIHFVLGLPASGKSSALADVISSEFEARIIDSDMIKENIPEYNDGWGSGVVHEESRDVMYKSFYDGLALGENLVIPRIGDPPQYIEEMMKIAKDAGYNVNVHMMDLDPNKALGRMLGRFVTTGRYIDPTWGGQWAQPGGLEKMNKSFDALRYSEYCDGYTKWSNDVNFGEKSVLLEYSGIGGRFIDDARIDIENLISIEEEDIFTEMSENMNIELIIKSEQVKEAKSRRNEAEMEIRTKTAEIKKDSEFRDNMTKEYEELKAQVLKHDVEKSEAENIMVKRIENIKAEDNTMYAKLKREVAKADNNKPDKEIENNDKSIAD